MNELEKRSFYSFLGLYIVSSFLFLLLVGYWYYTAQKNALMNESYYRLQHITDIKSGDIIMAHMKSKPLKSMDIPPDITLALIDTRGKIVEGKLLLPFVPHKTDYFIDNGYEVFVSDAPREHLNIRYVVAQSRSLHRALAHLRHTIVYTLSVIAVILAIIAWILSRLFMRPIHQKVEQIERFINDITHELNTPITSLSMSSSQALKMGECTQKTLKNISISTKQLYDIYRSLTYLNFSSQEEVLEPLDISKTLEKSVAYYQHLAEMKRIVFDVSLEKMIYTIPEAQATLLFGNLIGNAIKYSSPKSKIEIVLKDNVLTIKDEGIGIEEAQQKKIFEKFKRGTQYSGGFGIGLSIVKSICQRYHISIVLDSTLHHGTTFILGFPKV